MSLRKFILIGDQAVSSGSNAVALFVAAIVLPAAELTTYSLLQLISTSFIAFQRSILIEPSLALSTRGRRADIYIPWALIVLLPIIILSSAVSYLIFGRTDITLATLSMGMPIIQDLFRYRCMSLGKLTRVLFADSMWAALLVTGVVFIGLHSAFDLIVLWGGVGGLSTLFLLARADKVPGVKISEIWGLGRFQVAEWAVDMMTSAAPLLIVHATLPVGSVGAFRLAQTAMGPLNTLSSFVLVHFLLDSHAMQSSPSRAQRSVKRSVRALATVTAIYGIGAGLTFYMLKDLVSPELTPYLLYAVPSTVLAALITSPSTPFLAFARSMALQKYTVWPKFKVMAVNFLTTVAGVYAWRFWHVDPLVLVDATTALATLWAYYVMYRKALRMVASRFDGGGTDRKPEVAYNGMA